jgi:hypothetical protein
MGHGFLRIIDHHCPLQPGFLVCRVVFQHRGEVTPGTGMLPGLCCCAASLHQHRDLFVDGHSRAGFVQEIASFLRGQVDRYRYYHKTAQMTKSMA